MRVESGGRHTAFLLIGLLVLQILAALSAPATTLSSSVLPNHINSSLTDNGDGTWTVTYSIDMDTTLDSGNSTADKTGLSHFEVGWTDERQETRIGLLGLDLNTEGFPTNTTIEGASLQLHLDVTSGSVDAQAWSILRQDWMLDESTWITRNLNAQWSSPGALGNTDSGAWQDRQLILPNSSAVEFDVTQTVELAQYRQLNGQDSRAGFLLTPGFGSEMGVASFHSSESSLPSHRPTLEITFRWASPSLLSGSPSWVDIQPKLGISDADSSLDFTAQIRSEKGSAINAAVSWVTTSGTIDGSGHLTPSVSGIATISADGAGISGDQEVLIRPGAPLGLAMANSNYSITVDDVIPIIAHGVDQHWNPVFDLTFIWSASSGTIDSNGIYTPTEIGTHTVAAQWGNHVAISNVTVDVGGAAHIILPEGLTARAGVGTQIQASAEDRLGNPVPLSSAAGLDWTVERGTIDSAGYYVGQEVGTWQINVTSGVGANGTGWITVGPGLVNSLEIIDPNRLISADEALPLDLRWHDRVGNNVSVLLPLENWTAENGNFRINDGFVEWLPSQAGTWRISAHAEGVEAWIDLTVITGEITRVWIDAEHDILTADEETGLILQAEDSRGNRWPISAEWAVEEAEVTSSLVSDVDGVRFVGGLAGTWNVTASHSGPNGTYSTYLSIEIRPGRLAGISLAGDGTSITADESMHLNPVLTDADGNLIDGVQLNWTVDGEDLTPQLRLSGGVWQPTTTGDHLIEVDAAGRSARSRIYVNQGNPQRIEIGLSLMSGSVTHSGDVFQISTYAVDLDGNQEPHPVEWDLPHNSISIEETTEIGVYDARGLGEGIWEIEAQNGTARGNFTLQVFIGEARSLRIGQHGGSGEQGNTFSLEVNLVDYGGNPVPMQMSQFEFDTEIGSVRHDVGPYWLLDLENPGDGQEITIRYEGWTAVTYVDVEPTGLNRLTSSQSGQMLLGGFVVAGMLIGLLMLIMRKNSVSQPHWDDEYDLLPTTTTAPKDTNPVAKSAANPAQSRRSRRRLSHQRQQDRIRAMEDATVAIIEKTEPVAVAEEQQAVQSSGVLQAMDGTIQGQTGWYQTAQGESQYWQVDAAGQWSRVS
ncbi:MAG: DNRLRE domain-containing protein [Candidatus Thalassarchaeaceae archaeon]|nr:DNRLRE domain-containing protein [Candidatus Thalassarchaeaceae archaeon]